MTCHLKDLQELEPFFLPSERARIAKNLVYWRRKRRMTRAVMAQGIMPINKLKAYEKDSRDMTLADLLALAARLEVLGASLLDRHTQT